MTVPNKKDLRKLIRIYDRRRKSRNLCEALYVSCTLRLGRDSSERESRAKNFSCISRISWLTLNIKHQTKLYENNSRNNPQVSRPLRHPREGAANLAESPHRRDDLAEGWRSPQVRDAADYDEEGQGRLHYRTVGKARPIPRRYRWTHGVHGFHRRAGDASETSSSSPAHC